jgi:beta-lactamase superfamily II metal-dependent hydrolase
MPPTTTESTSDLIVHVINGGEGESIVLELPGGKWGVVDCFTLDVDDDSKNPTLEFLRRRQVDSLEFVCLTHPHDDHYRGLRQLLEALPTRSFWRFGAHGPADLQVTLLLRWQAETAADKEANDTANEYIRLLQTVKILRSSRSKSRLLVKHASGIASLYPFPFVEENADVRITSIAPSGNMVAAYQDSLGDCIDENNCVKSTLPRQAHNQVSMALLVEYGDARIILGGDVESKGWQEAMAEVGYSRLAAHAVKVSHHGSANGYAVGLWQSFARLGKPVAVVAPFRRFDLPDAAAMQHIGEHCSAIYSTYFDEPDASSEDSAGSETDGAIELAMRTIFSSNRRPKNPKAGICSLRLDKGGRCSVTTASPAGILFDLDKLLA